MPVMPRYSGSAIGCRSVIVPERRSKVNIPVRRRKSGGGSQNLFESQLWLPLVSISLVVGTMALKEANVQNLLQQEPSKILLRFLFLGVMAVFSVHMLRGGSGGNYYDRVIYPSRSRVLYAVPRHSQASYNPWAIGILSTLAISGLGTFVNKTSRATSQLSIKQNNLEDVVKEKKWTPTKQNYLEDILIDQKWLPIAIAGLAATGAFMFLASKIKQFFVQPKPEPKLRRKNLTAIAVGLMVTAMFVIHSNSLRSVGHSTARQYSTAIAKTMSYEKISTEIPIEVPEDAETTEDASDSSSRGEWVFLLYVLFQGSMYYRNKRQNSVQNQEQDNCSDRGSDELVESDQPLRSKGVGESKDRLSCDAFEVSRLNEEAGCSDVTGSSSPPVVQTSSGETEYIANSSSSNDPELQEYQHLEKELSDTKVSDERVDDGKVGVGHDQVPSTEVSLDEDLKVDNFGGTEPQLKYCEPMKKRQFFKDRLDDKPCLDTMADAAPCQEQLSSWTPSNNLSDETSKTDDYNSDLELREYEQIEKDLSNAQLDDKLETSEGKIAAELSSSQVSSVQTASKALPRDPAKMGRSSNGIPQTNVLSNTGAKNRRIGGGETGERMQRSSRIPVFKDKNPGGQRAATSTKSTVKRGQWKH